MEGIETFLNFLSHYYRKHEVKQYIFKQQLCVSLRFGVSARKKSKIDFREQKNS